MSIADGDKGLLVRCHAGCDARDVLAELRRRGLLEDRPERARVLGVHPPQQRAPAHEPDPAALAIWQAGVSIAGTIAERYLRARGLVGPFPPSLRAGTIRHLDRYALPCLVAAVQAPDRRIIAVQTTALDPRGDRKAQLQIPRRTVGALGWGAVRLAASGDVLGIAEGVEKAAAAMQLFNVPCWASLGAARMHRVVIPDVVRELHIYADNDDPGRAAAERTAHAHRHRRVEIHFPTGAKDWDESARSSQPVAAA